MSGPIIIKGQMLDSNKPMICIPVLDADKEQILRRVKNLIREDVSMIEWRVDYFEGSYDAVQIKEVLESLRDLMYHTILIVTIRTVAQGGRQTSSPEQMAYLLEEISKAHVADLIDVEFFTYEHPTHLIQKLQMNGALIISSHHDFEETPAMDVMKMILEKMLDGDADLVKLAVMPQEITDVLDLLKITADFHKEHPVVPLITMSLGKLGMISRISGEAFGSCVTFGAVEQTSAPGQVPREQLQKVLDFMHEYYVE